MFRLSSKTHPTGYIIILSIFILLLAACAPAASPPRQADQFSDTGVAPAESPRAGQGAPSELASSVNTSAQTDDKRIVLKNANLTLVVDDPSKSMDHISALADELDGFVVSANLTHTELDNGTKVPQASITIRVPAERLDEALSRIRAESKRLPLSENLQSQDVTSDYTDLQSRLRNLENTEAQLTKIMDAATKTEDVLSVYNQLVQVREQIEVIKGKIQYYDQSAALSAIAVELMANEAVQPLTIGGWQPAGVAKNAVQALIDTLKFLANAAIWMVIFVLPVLVVLYLVFVLPLSLVFRAWRRRRARNKPLAPPAASSSPDV